ncbi:MAG: hypothetical protein PHE17_21310 [Thiothrix sp.]|uniref:hypothetical protein n=1 Tax=Thiothrix sp. TaxID=1032 RepID=UPI0026351B57|nr:hypothetical protein [Thiothrix sp.]MDD5395569.1 hypothetical protein [Thiothrix sp.]
MSARIISKTFIKDLKEGILSPILRRVQNDETLFLAIRKDYVNIYYRGGNIMKIQELGPEQYSALFDKKYDHHKGGLPPLPAQLDTPDSVNVWVKSFPRIKEVMDFWFSDHPKLEREFQQVVARENNNSSVSNTTEYFITDVEFSDSEMGARFDMLAIQWLRGKRKHGNTCRPALIEMKFGDSALGGGAGLLKHLQDFEMFITDKERYKSLLETMTSQFDQMRELGGLIRFGNNGNDYKAIPDETVRPEVVFLLANHNPDSTILNTFLINLTDDYVDSLHFDLRFFVANFAGYGLHEKSMLTLAEFREHINFVDNRKG